MKAAKYVLAAALTCISLAAPGQLRADDIVQVTITNLSFVGNPVCGPTGNAACTETLNGSFLWDNTTNRYVSNSVNMTSVGPLGSFGASDATFEFDGQYGTGADPGKLGLDVAFVSPLNQPTPDFISVFFPLVTIGTPELPAGMYSLSPTSIPSPGGFSSFLACFSAECASDFPLAAPSGNLPATGSISVVPTPEPPTLFMVGSGLLFLLGMSLSLRAGGRA
jgi:hypothetical protein